MGLKLSGAEILLRSLINHNVKTIFGYPGSCVMLILDYIYKHKGEITHILVRHEQGAVCAAYGYAKLSGNPGVVLVTSGPAATNSLTGIVDAMANNIPLVVITGQVTSALLGTDAFQEVDVIGITKSVSKWNYQIRSAEQVAYAVARAFYIASTGEPGPVVLDITKDAQSGFAEYIPQKTNFIRTYNPYRNIHIENQEIQFPIRKGEKNFSDRLIEDLYYTDENTVLIIDLRDDHFSAINYPDKKRIIFSEKYGTPGLGLPAAIGAKYADSHKKICLITEPMQFQATIQELGVIKQSNIDIKIFLLNNSKPFDKEIKSPDFMQLVKAYDIYVCSIIMPGENLEKEIKKVLDFNGCCFLEIN